MREAVAASELFLLGARARRRRVFARSGLLFLPAEQVEQTTRQLDNCRRSRHPCRRSELARLSQTVSSGCGLQGGMFKLDDLARPQSGVGQIEDVLAGRPASFSWRRLLDGKPPNRSCGGSSTSVRPRYTALEPGHAATTTIRRSRPISSSPPSTACA
jgi:hypothetical protein